MTIAVVATIVVFGRSRSTTSATTTTDSAALGPAFVRAPRSLIAACRATAGTVGYRVPCPTRIPAGLTETGTNGQAGCALHIIGAGGTDRCSKSWRGWVIGSSTTSGAHLVITASPTPLLNYAKVVNGPAWYPNASVKPVASPTINGRRARAVFVPAASNDGSAFADHVVLIWTAGSHTYGVGFHNERGIEATLKLDEALVKSIRLVGS